MSAISLRSISKDFNGAAVIRDVSVEIADGEFCVLVGPSGSGKSTLLRLIAGLEEPSSGEIHIGARDVTHEPPKRRDIAMVFQSYALYPQMTVRDNMGFGLRLAGVDKKQALAKVDAAAEMLGLTTLLDRFPRQLSGGQRQRVAMGRAIVREPAVYLFDEPLSNLDAALRVQVRGEIVDMHQRLRTTAVYVTHDQVEAMSMGDRIVVLRDGRVEQTGTPHELYQRPANRFVASFIGSPAMNLLDGELVAGDSFATAVGRSALPMSISASGPATLGLRPEHCRLLPHDTAANAQDLTLDGEVRSLEFTGADTLVQVGTKLGTVTAICDDRSPWRRGDPVRVSTPPDRLHLFDGRGQRLSP
ncbi:ABC transporter ATP-binding protein [Paucibacter sp. JuS9]|uniref:ABC transporter ATP-binding protein n=1 Tax=Paucibacter sp. JuS9 TaxID=3228748 RepID=UPI003757C7DE